jgi:hypothetical protein
MGGGQAVQTSLIGAAGIAGHDLGGLVGIGLAGFHIDLSVDLGQILA